MMRKLLILTLVVAWLPGSIQAKSYSSGGRSYSSSSRSSSGGSSGSRSGSSASRSSSSSKSYSSGSGRTYSSSSPVSGASSGRSYSSGSSSGKTFSSSTGSSPSAPAARSSFSFDTGAARAQKEAASKRDFTTRKQSQRRPASEVPSAGSADYGARPTRPETSNPRGAFSGSSQPAPYLPSPQNYSTRRIRVDHYFAPYYSRPVVVYRDSYSSFFWWWLLDRSLEDRAMWAYNHRASMDAARYQAMLVTDTNLEMRVRQLETDRTPVNPNYTPAGMDADLMYSDQVVQRAYLTRPTFMGRVLFWLFMAPTVMGTVWFLVWFIFFKRWRTA